MGRRKGARKGRRVDGSKKEIKGRKEGKRGWRKRRMCEGEEEKEEIKNGRELEEKRNGRRGRIKGRRGGRRVEKGWMKEK